MLESKYSGQTVEIPESAASENPYPFNGNFPLWLTDFFPKNRRTESRHAHILDFDVLRLGRRVLENNPRAGSFEFGVVAITEIGKERGNNLELKEVRKGADDTNQKNDLFNSWLKMCRHSATVDIFFVQGEKTWQLIQEN